LPSFLEQIKKARRSDAKQSLFNVVANMEQYYQDNKGYPSTAAGDDMITLGYNADPYVSSEGYYETSFVFSTTTTFTIEAAPIGTQAIDAASHADCSGTCCGTYRLDQLGAKTVTDATLTADQCW